MRCTALPNGLFHPHGSRGKNSTPKAVKRHIHTYIHTYIGGGLVVRSETIEKGDRLKIQNFRKSTNKLSQKLLKRQLLVHT